MTTMPVRKSRVRIALMALASLAVPEYVFLVSSATSRRLSRIASGYPNVDGRPAVNV